MRMAHVPCELFNSTLLLRTRRRGDHIGLVAERDDGVVVGLTHALFRFTDDYVTRAPALACYMEDLFVDPSCRGSGAGKALIEAVYRGESCGTCVAEHG